MPDSFIMKKTVFAFIIGLSSVAVFPQYSARMAQPAVQANQSGLPEYTRDARANRIPDYSYCGYMASEQLIPEVPVKAVVSWMPGDNTARIQQAIDYVSSLEPDAQGFRGAVLLEKGCYEIAGGLTISASGVVLRGSGYMDGQTELLGTGMDRTTMIRVAGKKDYQAGQNKEISSYVPTGARTVVVQGHSFEPGDRIRITRPGTQAWIDAMDMNDFGGESSYIGWKPEDMFVYWERQVKEVRGDSILLDAPLSCSLDPEFGGGFVSSFEWPGRISRSGVENLRLRSTYDTNNPKDENHRWVAINLDNIEDAWVRRIEFRHFAGSAVFLTENTRRITVEDCKSIEPISEIGGQRRQIFFTLGGQCLFQRLYSEYGFHDFAVGRCAPGPNAFVQCYARMPYNFSGTVDSWSTGVLFDVVTVEGHGIYFSNRGQDGLGAGWTTANSMMWNCSASMLACPLPPTAYNWSYGAWGQRSGNAAWNSAGSFVKPHSLYYAQLAARTGKKHPDEDKLMPFDTSSATNPPLDRAQEFVAEARKPALELKDWMDSLTLSNPLTLTYEKSKKNDPSVVWQKKSAGKTSTVSTDPAGLMKLEGGVLVKEEKILTGGRRGVVWWNGNLRLRYLATARPHITRYAPGRTGTGFTDDLDEMTDNMLRQNVLVTDHNYGLWYDRRRDDHERIMRMDGYVWPPFYELPFSRSGQGTAWDGLSKYDLTQWNVWYWNRLKKYADLADEKGLVLFHQHYFQHNILEAGAHWADFPWRSANNVNETGFPEPVPYAGDKRIFMAELFYDVQHPVRRELHRNYIRKCLDNFASNGSVLQFISEEFTGPLHFVEFWLDVIAEWEAETRQDAKVVLCVTKDVQDKILDDPKRAAIVDIIDIKYWRPLPGGGYTTLLSDLNLAPRQQTRAGSTRIPGDGAADMPGRVYETILSLRETFPDKAVLYSAGGSPQEEWAAFMAGASLCNLPARLPEQLLRDASKMQTIDSQDWMRGHSKLGYIAYSRAEELSLDLRNARGKFEAQWLDARSGEPKGKPFKIKAGSVHKFKPEGILWLHK
jgi:hypothetical protein